jgi:tyrosyl-tRNA synthetase
MTDTNPKKIKVKIGAPIVDILIKKGLVKSKAEFVELAKSGGISFKVKQEERSIVDPQSLAEESGEIKIGKKKFLKLDITKN